MAKVADKDSRRRQLCQTLHLPLTRRCYELCNAIIGTNRGVLLPLTRLQDVCKAGRFIRECDDCERMKLDRKHEDDADVL